MKLTCPHCQGKGATTIKQGKKPMRVQCFVCNGEGWIEGGRVDGTPEGDNEDELW